MNVSLTPELETLVHEKVGSGLYTSASEVIRAGLRLLQVQESQQRLEELKRDIALGLEQLERGEVKIYDDLSLKARFEEIKAQGRERLAASQGKAA